MSLMEIMAHASLKEARFQDMKVITGKQRECASPKMNNEEARVRQEVATPFLSIAVIIPFK